MLNEADFSSAGHDVEDNSERHKEECVFEQSRRRTWVKEWGKVCPKCIKLSEVIPTYNN